MKKIKNNLKKIFLILNSLFLLLFLSSCAKYDGKKLSKPYAPVHEKNNIEVAQKALTENECKEYFGGRNLLKRGYQPIQIYVKNNSDRTMYINPNYITLPLEPASSVAKKLHRDIGWKVTKYFFIGGPLWAAIEGVASNDANKVIDSDINEKSVRLDRAIKIRPHGIINKVMFVSKENYPQDFNISLIEAKSNKRIKFNL
jgi:hypothetical protein